MSKLFQQKLPDSYHATLFHLKEQTDLTVAEILRRMMGHCFQKEVLNHLFPQSSGSLTTPFLK